MPNRSDLTLSVEKAGPAPLVSVVIPVKNGEATIESCLEGILAQSLAEKLEIIVIDSGSTDATLSILARYRVSVHSISPEEFNHGETRNLGARLARGEYVVMTVQDARPAGENWLEQMCRHFSNPHVAGVCGIQIVAHDEDKNPLQWFRPVDMNPQPKTVHFEATEDFANLSTGQQHQSCRWDDVNAMYRREVLLKIPFRPVSFAEDALWARDALMEGHALVYEPNARVYHYHHENFAYRFKRTYTVLYHTYHYFKYFRPAQPLLSSLLRCTYSLARGKTLSFSKKVKWIGYNTRLIFSSWLANRIAWIALHVFGAAGFARSHAYFCKEVPHAPNPAILNFNK